MPPVFSLTPPQRRALEVLDWLHDGTENYRRTGRSMVLALSYLRRLIVNPAPWTLNRGGWLEIEDHVPGSRDLDRHLVQVIERLAADIGFNGVEVHPSGIRIRVRADARISREVIEALTLFGERAEADQQPPPIPRLPRMMRPHLPGTPPVVSEPKPAQPDPVTLWDHLEDD